VRSLIRPLGGEPVGGGMIRKVTAKDTGGVLSIFEGSLAGGAFIPPHVHAHEDETTFVVEGSLHVVVGDAYRVACAGSYVLKPRGTMHAFWNAGPSPARVIEIITPGTLDEYFTELFAIAAGEHASERQRAEAIDAHHSRFGIRFDSAARERLVHLYAIPSAGPPMP
jgi:quercetin dioxygenase-like cupin family protein